MNIIYKETETVSTCGSQMQLRCGASEAVGPATCLWIAVLRHEDYEDACKTYLSSTNRETFSQPKPECEAVFTLRWLELLQCWMLTEDTSDGTVIHWYTTCLPPCLPCCCLCVSSSIMRINGAATHTVSIRASNEPSRRYHNHGSEMAPPYYY